MLSTSHHLEYLEANCPLSEEEEKIIVQSIRPAFMKQVRFWFLMQKASKKRYFIDLLSGKKHPKAERSRPLTSMSRPYPHNELIARSGSTTIDIGSSFSGKQSSRRINGSRFESRGIISQGIFGTPGNSLRNREARSDDSLAKFIVKRFVFPDISSKILEVANDYYSILQELQEWVDKKCNSAPVSEISEPSSIHPNLSRTFNRQINNEDHVSRPLTPQPDVTFIRERSTSRPWKVPQTMYSEFFEEEKSATISPPCPPIVLSQPFCPFPTKSELPITKSKSTYLKQAIACRKYGREFKSIFESPTQV